jgi:hypothetical protein
VSYRHDLHPEHHFALVTSTSKRIVNAMPQLNHIPWAFVGGYEGEGTEKNTQILACCAALKTTLADVIYIGDSPSDRSLATSLKIPYLYPRGSLITEIFEPELFVDPTPRLDAAIADARGIQATLNRLDEG